MTPAAQATEAWMPNGFPPPSFVVETERTGTFAGTRGRWLAAAAILGALLLIAGILLIARDDDKTDVATSSTTTVFGATTPTFSDSTALDPAATLPEATTVPGGGAPVDPGATTVPGAAGGGGGAPGTTAAPGGGTPSGPPAPGAGVLTASTGTVALGRVDSSVGPGTGKLTLSNTGASALSFTSSSESPGALTVSPGSGSLAPGAATEVTITLDGAKVGEGGFSRAVGFSANGATQRVNVTATVVHLPTITDAGAPCPVENATCSKQIQITTPGAPANATPCTHAWRYRVNVADESVLKSVGAEATVPQFTRALRSADGSGPPNGPQGFWASDPFPPIGTGTFKFTIVAVDQFDATRRSTERTIAC